MFEGIASDEDRAWADARLEGVGAGQIVAWLGLNSTRLFGLLAACESRGAVLLPMNWRLALPEWRQILQHAQAARLVCDETFSAQGAALGDVLHTGPAEGLHEGDLLLVYTSGTTGEPKGAIHTAAGMRANVEAAIEAQALTAQDRVLSVLPLFHVGGLCIQTLPALCVGAAVALHPRFDPVAWFDTVAQWRPTTSLLVPAVMRALVEHPRWAGADLSSLAYINSGSQIVPAALIEAFQARGVPVAQVYGATETGPVSIVLPARDAARRSDGAGRAALGVTVKLADDGEILLKAPNLMRGYHRSTTSGIDAQGFFHTGDLACELEPGWYQVVGRNKELIISGGENIHPAEIENLISSHPAVAECAVVGLPDARWGEVPVLAVVRRPGVEADPAAILAALDGRVATFKRPRQVVWVDDLPKTALGKVQRAALVERLLGSIAPPGALKR
jgi:fatty-acyl-CoA synthase